MKQQTKSYFLAILAVFFWSTVATAFKIALGRNGLDFIQLLFISTLTASIVLFGILVIQKKIKLLFKIPKNEFFKLIALSILNPVSYYLILFKAYSLLPAQMAQSLNYTWPIVLVVLSTFLLKQRLRIKTIVSFIISFIGVIIISFKGKFNLPNDVSMFGVILAVGSSLIWASYWIFNTKNKMDDIIKLFYNFFIGALLISILMFTFSRFPLNINFKFILAGVYSGVFEMGLTFVVWNLALKLTSDSSKISNLIFLSPFISLFYISFFLNEKILFSTIIGLVVVIFGIFIDKISFISKN